MKMVLAAAATALIASSASLASETGAGFDVGFVAVSDFGESLSTSEIKSAFRGHGYRVRGMRKMKSGDYDVIVRGADRKNYRVRVSRENGKVMSIAEFRGDMQFYR